MPKLESRFNLHLVNAPAPRQHGVSWTFQVAEMTFQSKVQRGTTFVDAISEIWLKQGFEPLPVKGFGKCTQKWTNPQMWHPFEGW